MSEDREQVSLCGLAPPVMNMKAMFMMMHVLMPYIREMRHQADYALDAPTVMPAGSCVQEHVTSEEMDEDAPSITFMAFQSEVRRDGEG